MESLRIAVAQMQSSADDHGANLAKASGLIGKASKDGNDLVVLPEFYNVEYFAQYWDMAFEDYGESLDGPTITCARQSARDGNVWVVATILEKVDQGLYYDTAVLIDRAGEISGSYRKVHPAAVYSLEKIYFRYGSLLPVFNIDDWRVGVSICYDNLFPELPRSLAVQGAHLIVAPYATSNTPVWREIHQTRAFENGVYYAVCNKVGLEGEWVFRGQSMIIDPRGQILSEGSDKQDEIISASLDPDRLESTRRQYPMIRDRRPDLYWPLTVEMDTLEPSNGQSYARNKV